MLSNIDHKEFFDDLERGEKDRDEGTYIVIIGEPMCAPARSPSLRPTFVVGICDELLIEAYQMVTAVARKKVPSDAEDLTQSVMLKFWVYSQTHCIDWDRHRGLFYSIAERLIIDTLRAESRKRRAVEGYEVHLAWRDESRDPADEIEIREAVTEVLNELRPIYREVLVLRYIEDYAPSEICALLDITSNCCSSRINRARAAFARLWSSRYGSSDCEGYFTRP